MQEDFKFNRAYLNGAKEMEPRWKRCVQATDRALGDALGQLYVEKTFGAEGKARMAGRAWANGARWVDGGRLGS